MAMKHILSTVFVLLGAATATAQTQVPNEFQAGQPARAAEVNENFNALEQATDANVADIASHQSRLDALETATDANAADNVAQETRVKGHNYRVNNLERALELLGQEYGVCSARNISACQGLLGGKNLAIVGSFLSFDTYAVTDPVDFNTIFALVWERSIGISDDPTDDRVRLVFGRQANFTRGSGVPNGEVLVDSCTDPTVYLVPTGSPRTGGLGVDNGKAYVGDAEAAPVIVDVTGGSYGLIYDYTQGLPVPPAWDRVGSPPLCLPVSDREGSYDSYPLILREDTSTWGTEWSLTADDLLNQ